MQTTVVENLQFIHETEEAILVEFDYGDSPELNYNRFWIPKSVITSEIEWVDVGEFYVEDTNNAPEILVADIEIATWWIGKSEYSEEFIDAMNNARGSN